LSREVIGRSIAGIATRRAREAAAVREDATAAKAIARPWKVFLRPGHNTLGFERQGCAAVDIWLQIVQGLCRE
jgi:hypothetical protein